MPRLHPRRRFAALVSTFALSLASPALGTSPDASPPASDAQADLIAIERNIIHYTNQQRKAHGLPPLQVDAGLMRSARAHCAWMTRTRNLVHTAKTVGENIAMGQRHSREAVADWMTSPGHRANILNGRYRRIGVAAYRTPSGTIFWCQQFYHQ